MATRYWVGGAGNWSSTTKWSTTSGGTSGASVPIATDDVVFDANSGLTAGLIATVDTAQTCNNLTITPNATVGSAIIAITVSLTVNGTMSCSGTAGNQRMRIQGTTYGLQQNLIVNAVSSLADLDFRDIIVTGTAAPISGTRIGNLRGCSGITFSTPKTVYWNLSGAQNWSANGWASSSGGTPATSNFPLAQDTAVFDNTGSVTGTITMDTAIPYTGTVDMSARTNAMTLANGTNAITVYGDWKNGSGTTLSGGTATTFSGRNTQTITSAGITWNSSITIDSYGGTVQFADAFNNGSNIIIVTNGTLTTNGYSVNSGGISSSNSNVRTINLGASTLTLVSLAPFNALTNTNLKFNAGTSQINCTTVTSGASFGYGLNYYNVSFTGAASPLINIVGSNTFNNFSITAPSSVGLLPFSFSGNNTINGTLTCAGSDAVHRIFLYSSSNGTQRTLTVNSLSANYCDFRDIAIAGTASGSSPTGAGNCGGNSGITFPAPKTVYWNLAGAQNWSATGWATSSGGTPALANFPLAQDTAVFDNTGSVTGTITLDQAWNIGTFNASARTNAMTFATGAVAPSIYGNWTNGTGLTLTGTGALTFLGRSTQTITTAGITFTQGITVSCPSGTVQLGDALLMSSTATLSQTSTTGTFNALTYNVTVGLFSRAGGPLFMGSGTWTLTGVGTVWSVSDNTFNCGTANIVLSNTSTSARTFSSASGGTYNKLTIGGTTGTSTTTITGSGNQFSELASTKTVAHTIIFPSSVTTVIGKWSVTGTVGNVVTIGPSTAATTYTISIAGAAPSGIDYLSITYCTLLATSPAEFFAGANSTNGTGNTGLTFTATPSARTLYWVGGTGNWSSTTSWSTTSGGTSGAAIPTSLDSVIFNTLSNATAYTATVDPTQARCAALTIGAPLTGALTFAGTGGLAIAGNTSIAASNVTRTFTGTITLSGSSSYTFTTNGVALSSPMIVNGVGSTWTLGSALDDGTAVAQTFTVANGTFDTGSYSFKVGSISSSNTNQRTINLNSSTVTCTVASGTPLLFTTNINLTFNAGTSQINISGSTPTSVGGGLTFYNVSFTATTLTTSSIIGVNTFNNLSVAGLASSGIAVLSVAANQTINNTFTVSAGTDATCRTMVQSSTLGTTVTLTCNAVSLTDTDFRDITIAGTATPASGTRLGDCKGNTGITFSAPKTVYWVSSFGGNWGSASWLNTSSGTGSATYFPLAQDTAIIPATTPNNLQTITMNANYNIGTFDMSARTSNTMTLATGTTAPFVYGNWINGTGTTLSGTGALTFAGRGSQTITNAGVTFTQPVAINSPSGSVTLQDALNLSGTSTTILTLLFGTFNANGYAVTIGGGFSTAITNTRTLAIGSATWTLGGSTTIWNALSTNLTVTGTGTISATNASAKTFTGGGVSYSGITINQGGAGALTISGNNTFANITNTYGSTGATSIALGATTQTVGNFTASGTSGNLLTITGTSAASPATLIYSGGGTVSQDYIVPTYVRAYPLSSTWYAGNHSTNGGSLGYIFAAGTVAYFQNVTASVTATLFLLFALTLSRTYSVSVTGTPTFTRLANYFRTLTDSVTSTVSYIRAISKTISQSVTSTVSESQIKVKLFVLSALSSITTSITEIRGKLISVSVNSTVNVLKAINKIISTITETAIVVLSDIALHLVALSKVVTGSPTIARALLKSLSYLSISNISVVKNIQKSLLTVSSAVISIIKAVNKTISYLSSSTSSISIYRAKIISLAVSSSVKINNLFGKTILIASNTIVQINKAISVTFNVISVTIVSILSSVFQRLGAVVRYTFTADFRSRLIGLYKIRSVLSNKKYNKAKK